MRILVTGANGNLGNYLCEELLSRGHSVRAMTHYNSHNLTRLKKDLEIVKADIRIVDGKIESIAPTLRTRTNDTVVDAKGLTVFPGFIQLHAHFCQTIFRHMAEDLSLFSYIFGLF